MKISLILISFFTIIYAKTINLAVAANASEVIKELANNYSKSYSDIKINISVGSSGKLSAQIINGAPYDIFLSADKKYPLELKKRGFGVKDYDIYARGALVLFSTKMSNLELNCLLSKSIKKIAIANDKTAPYGVVTKEALMSLKLYNKLRKKFIYGESIGQTIIFALKAADAAILARSQLKSSNLKKYKEGKNWVDINRTLYTPTTQAMLQLQNGEEIDSFYNFLLSKKAKEIFKKYGYLEN